MDTFETIRSRHSVRAFRNTPVPRETLQGLVDLVRLNSPSGANKNTWRFVAIERHDSLVRLAQAHRNGKWLSEAQCGIAIFTDPALNRYWLEDCSVAAYLIWLAATAQGLGVGWAAMYQSDSAEETEARQQIVRETLAIPDNFMVPIVLGIGYPEGQPSAKPRPELKDIFYRERYSGSMP